MPFQIGRRAKLQAPFLIVLAVLAAAFVYLFFQPDHWRRGSLMVATAMALAAVLRGSLSGPHAGWLAVRGRWRDVACYVGFGALILAATIKLG
ncbi:MAG: DUF3017 domain-containing protein [Jatrophihabitantaceae bacterium]